ncbi:hypothetical protein [Lactiplantibacillus carotarum]|uniref:hypothetical protein n=1 Tax=Lactiplantibacillus carotarum TaxID=2993456 RepID=UPI00298EDD28|nr:hypothetical protein [Lactiplantibacillus carotarum]
MQIKKDRVTTSHGRGHGLFEWRSLPPDYKLYKKLGGTTHFDTTKTPATNKFAGDDLLR